MWKQTKFTGMDVRNDVLFVASLEQKKGKTALSKLDVLPLEEQLDQLQEWNADVETEAISPSAQLGNVLKEYRAREKRMSPLVHFCLPTKHVVLRKIDTLPNVPDNRLAQLLNFEIGESIHLPFQKPVYDFVRIRDSELSALSVERRGNDPQLDGDPHCELLLLATSEQLVKHLARNIRSAGCKPLSAEICATALERLVRTLHPEWLQGLDMILDIQEDGVDLHFYRAGFIVFSRSIPLAKEAGFHSNEVSFVEEAAAGLESEAYGEGTIGRAAFYRRKKSWNESIYLAELLNEVERAQSFYRYTFHRAEQPFSSLILTGDFTESFYQSLLEQVDYPVRRLDYTSILSPGFQDSDLLDICSVAIGLALRGKYKRSKNRAGR